MCVVHTQKKLNFNAKQNVFGGIGHTIAERKRAMRAKHANKLLGRYKIEVEKRSNIKSLYNKQTLAAMEQASNMYSQKEAKTNTNRKHPRVFLPMQTHLNQFK